MSTSASLLSGCKILNTYNLQVLKYLETLLVSIGCPREASASYQKYLVTRLVNEGFPFVKKLKSLYTYGLKVLAGDPTITPPCDFRLIKGKPKLFRFVFTTLEKQKLLGSNFDPVVVRTCLSILSTGKMVYTEPDPGTKNDAVLEAIRNLSQPVAPESNITEKAVRMFLKRKVPRFTPRPPSAARMSGKYGVGTWRKLPFPIARYWQSLSKDPKAFLEHRLSAYFVMKDVEPVGKLSLLVEHGAKLRVISVFNPWMNSLSLWEDLRGYLDSIENDVSKDQAGARPYLEKVTSHPIHPYQIHGPRLREATKPIKRKGLWSKFIGMFSKSENESVSTEYMENYRKCEHIVSADLSSATDLLSPRVILDFLYDIGYGAIYPVITSKVRYPVNSFNTEEVLVRLTKPPMGLGGCFEIFSAVHHAVVQLFCTTEYRICGDDLVGVFDLDTYEKQCADLGLSLNRSKSIVSKTTAQFCGMVYHLGKDVSPIRLPKSLGLGTIEDLRSQSVEFYDKTVNLFPSVRKYAKRYIYKHVLPVFHGKSVSLLLPNRLGGFNIQRAPNLGLSDVLDKRKHKLIASAYVREPDEDREVISRVPIPELRPASDVYPFTQALYKDSSHAVKVPKRYRVRTSYMPHKGSDLCETWEILESYYSISPKST